MDTVTLWLIVTFSGINNRMTGNMDLIDSEPTWKEEEAIGNGTSRTITELSNFLIYAHPHVFAHSNSWILILTGFIDWPMSIQYFRILIQIHAGRMITDEDNISMFLYATILASSSIYIDTQVTCECLYLPVQASVFAYVVMSSLASIADWKCGLLPLCCCFKMVIILSIFAINVSISIKLIHQGNNSIKYVAYYTPYYGPEIPASDSFTSSMKSSSPNISGWHSIRTQRVNHIYHGLLLLYAVGNPLWVCQIYFTWWWDDLLSCGSSRVTYYEVQSWK